MVVAKSENKGKKCCKYRHDTVCKTLVAKKSGKVAKKRQKGKKLSGQNHTYNHTYTYTYKYDF